MSYAHHDVARRGSARNTGAGVVTAIALAAGAFVLFSHGPTHNVSASLALTASNDDNLSAGDSCTGTGGYDDITGGSQFDLENGDGKTLATSRLSDGVYDGVSCVFEFTFPKVPKSKFYVIKSSTGDRGEQRYSFDDMVSQHWEARLTLGDNS